eukprot:TRINITY_DN69728_c0_g1_i1.p1 TRINITY_DN69728_c0_g1~~TRINITY_DN69728_c0_g1_i1.p1  ORF type:complete len:611 (-),score=92.15 TRINITY_DN69728_c0_g1_i1:538-2370(-)
MAKVWTSQRNWDDRHHVVESRNNQVQTRTQRRLFDNLPGLRVRGGAYVDFVYAGKPAEGQSTADIIRKPWGRLTRGPTQKPVEWALKAVTPGPGASSTAIIKADLAAASPTSPLSQASTRLGSVCDSRGPSPRSGGFGDHSNSLGPMKGVIERAWVWAGADQDRSRSIATMASPTPESPADRVAAASGNASPCQAVAEAQPAVGGIKFGCQSSVRRGVGKKVVKANSDAISGFSQISGQEPWFRWVEWAKGRFGDVTRCWRLIDKDESMGMSKFELLHEIRQLGYRSTSKELECLWACMDRDRSGNVAFFHYDPVTAFSLALVKRWCTLRFGGVQKAAACFDKDRSGAISLEEFSSGCQRNGFSHDEELYLLFNFLGKERNAQLQTSSFTFLDSWECPEYFCVAADPQGTQTFKEVLMHRHKYNGLRAWRKALDKDGSMRVNWLEFKKSGEQLLERYPKEFANVNFAAVWRHLDRCLIGYVCLDDFDPEGFRLLSMFVSWATEAHGSVSRAFKFLTKDASNADKGLGRGKLARALTGSGYCELSEEDAEKLFDGLNLEEGDRIQYSELRFLERWSPSAEAEERRGWTEFFGPQLHKASAAMVACEAESNS